MWCLPEKYHILDSWVYHSFSYALFFWRNFCIFLVVGATENDDQWKLFSI
jgi:hypothetical protein